MAEAQTSKAVEVKEERKQQQQQEQEKQERPKPLPSISIPDRPSAEAFFKESRTRSSTETLTLTDQDPSCRSFSQLLAGAMASPAAVAANSSPAAVLEVKPTLVLTLAVDPAHFPLVAQPAFIGVLTQGQFGMTHQEALASVTAQAQAQAQMQLQTGYPSPSLAVPSKSLTQPMLSALSPTPLQQRRPSVSEDNSSITEMEQHTSPDQKPQSAHGNVKTPSSDGYNWRKYGQKQVKSSESSRSYYRCTNANCVAKKKIERCHDGHVAEIIYKGQHNHEPPQKIRCKKEGEAPSGGPFGGNETGDIAGENVSESNPPRTEQTSCQTIPEPQLHSSSNCDGDADTGADEDQGDEPDPKRRIKDNTISHSTPLLKTVKEPKVVVQTGSESGGSGDGYRWRKYGQKIVKGNPNPRSYYKCTHVGCPVRKHVEKASDDEKALIITYEGKHNHESPASKSSYDIPITLGAPAAAATTAPMSAGEKLKTSDTLDEPPSTQSPTDVEGKLAGEKAKELGGEKALESAQTLLSIGLNSNTSEEDAGVGAKNPKNPNVIQRPLFNENSSAVSV